MARRASRTSFGLAPRSPRVDLLKQRARGFTIVELLIVVVVIAILAAITVVAYTGIQNRAHDSSVKNDLRQLTTKVEAYRAEFGAAPRGDAVLGTLGLKVSRASYGDLTLSSSSDSSNILYCSPAANTQTYAWIARSKSGTIWFQGTAGTGTFVYSAADTTELCANAGITVTGGTSDRSWGQLADTWASWL